MEDPVKTRRYRSPRRAQQAAATRTAVLLAARDLFTTTGYAATTVTEVARRAGVSLDTVYASVGRKPELLLAVHDMALAGREDPQAAQDRDYVAAVRRADGAAEKLRVYAQALATRLPHVVPLVEALRRAAEDDPACRATWESLDARRAANMLDLARELRSTGDLRPDLSDADVAHRLWLGNSAELYRLATARGGGPAAYARIVLELWSTMLRSD